MIDPQFWRGRRVLVTGHTGFKGSWLTLWLASLGARVTGLALAPSTEPSLFEAIDLAEDCASHLVDIRDAAAVARIVGAARPAIVFHLAAQPLVRASYADAAGTWMTNAMGTVFLLEALRAVEEVRAIVVVTSDKCYAQDGLGRAFREGDALGGHDPYSSSKAAAEIAAASWRHSFFDAAGVGVATARAGNVIGGGDWACDRLVPDLVRGAIAGRSVPIRYPRAIRPWQHVGDPLFGYLMLAERLTCDPQRYAGAWNFGPGDEEALSVGTVAERFTRAFGRGARWHAAEDGSVHEAATLTLDSRKAREQLGWQPSLSIDEAIEHTAEAYRVGLDGGDVWTKTRATMLAPLDAAMVRPGLRGQPMSRSIPIRVVADPAPGEAPDREDLRAQIRELVTRYAEQQPARSFEPGVTAVPPSGKVVGAPEMINMVDAALDGWLTTGRFNALFEQRLAAYVGVNHALTVNSGSSANLVAFTALTSPLLGDRAIRPGDEVITVAAGFPTTVNPILQNRAVPVFVDVDIPTCNIDASRLEAARSERTRAVMLAHTLGNPFDLDAVVAFCERHHLWLVEDCCDALGATYRGRKVGTFGDLATLSFYPAHHITMGEGGAVLVDDPTLKRAAESIRDWGRDCWCAPGADNTCGKRFDWQLGDLPYGYDHKYSYSHLGYNLKITDMQAACGLAQMDRLDGFIAARRHNFEFLHRRLAACAAFIELPEATPHADPSWFGFPITLRPAAEARRVDLLTYLDQRKIGTRLLFSGNLTRQPYMQGREFRVAGSLTRTDRVMNDTFWIGVYPGLDQAMLDYAAAAIEQFFGVGF